MYSASALSQLWFCCSSLPCVSASGLRLAQVEPLGGGRILHDPLSRRMTVYGYSQAYGQADHVVSRAIIARMYPLHDIEVSDEGY